MLANKVLSPLAENGYVKFGYGQVEPNHLSAQRTGQIYAQLPAAAGITVLENGQFVKYDYGHTPSPEVNLTGKGEWMLVFNEVKTYRDGASYADFAMLKDNYSAKIYSPAKAAEGKSAEAVLRDYSGITAPADPYELHSTTTPFQDFKVAAEPAEMPIGTTMVPRVFKTNIGDIFTTNTIKEKTLKVGDVLTPGVDGYLAKAGAEAAAMKWQVVKVYTMPDGQPGVKVMRIA